MRTNKVSSMFSHISRYPNGGLMRVCGKLLDLGKKLNTQPKLWP